MSLFCTVEWVLGGRAKKGLDEGCEPLAVLALEEDFARLGADDGVDCKVEDPEDDQYDDNADDGVDIYSFVIK